MKIQQRSGIFFGKALAWEPGMSQLSPALGTMKMLGLLQTQAQAQAQTQTDAPPAAAPAKSSGFSFHDFLSIINPLQHLPIIGTLYRAITGDKIGIPEKIAGDTLYGGLLGAVTSIADAAFEAITGKDVGDTVLALFTGKHDSDKPVAVAANTQTPAAATPDIPATDFSYQALSDAMAAKGIDNTLSQRALAAYRRSMILPVAQQNTVLAAAQ
jgi:hypothetical protein